MEPIYIILGALIGLGLISWLVGTISSAVYKRNEVKKLEIAQKKLFLEYKQEVNESLNTLLNEKSKGFPWLASAIADYYENYDNIFAKYLETKKRPAVVQAERIKEIAKEKKLFKGHE